MRNSNTNSLHSNTHMAGCWHAAGVREHREVAEGRGYRRVTWNPIFFHWSETRLSSFFLGKSRFLGEKKILHYLLTREWLHSEVVFLGSRFCSDWCSHLRKGKKKKRHNRSEGNNRMHSLFVGLLLSPFVPAHNLSLASSLIITYPWPTY